MPSDPELVLRALSIHQTPLNLGTILRTEIPEEILIAALARAESDDAETDLMYSLAKRGSVAALPEIVKRLDHDDPVLRSYAADAIGDIAATCHQNGQSVGPEFGQALYDRYTPDAPDVYLTAMAAASHTPVIPLLIDALASDSASTRRSAAWGLGYLGAAEAKTVLTAALAHETDPGTKEMLEWACEQMK